MRGNILKDRSGKISGAIAALLAIIVILIYMRAASTPKGSEDAFYTVYGALKWFLKTLDLEKYVEEYLREFEEFLKYVQGTELWPLIVSILALVVMELAVMGIYCGTWITIDTTTSILGWVSSVRASRKKYSESYGKSRSSIGRIMAAFSRLGKLRQSKRYTPSPSIKEKVAKLKKQPLWRRLSLTEWWDFGENQLITLKEGMLRYLIVEAKKLYPTKLAPKGSITKLAEKSGIDSSILCRAMNQEDYTMTVKNLEKLLNTLRIPYREITPYIKSIGGGGFKESITHPKLPFDLYNEDGAILIAAGLKDGHIRKDRTSFEYINYNNENVQRIIESAKRIFGDVNYQMRYDEKGRQKGVLFHSEVIGLALHRAGVPKGRKTEQDYHLPDGIKFGDLDMKKKYFKQVIRDEGDINYRKYRIRMTNAKEIHSKAMPEHVDLFENQKWKRRTYPSGKKEPYIRLTKKLEYNLPPESRSIYHDFLRRMKKEWIPPILNDERKLLEETYGVKVDIIPKDIYKGKKVGLSGSWELVIGGKKNFEKFVKLLDLNNEDKGDES